MKKHIILAMAVLFTAIASQASELNVYPVPAVFNGKQVDNAPFGKVLNNHRQEFINLYLKDFDKYFPNLSLDK